MAWKLQYTFIGLLILAATWLGYFIGYSLTPYDSKTGLLIVNGEIFHSQRLLSEKFENPKHKQNNDMLRNSKQIVYKYVEEKMKKKEETVIYIQKKTEIVNNTLRNYADSNMLYNNGPNFNEATNQFDNTKDSNAISDKKSNIFVTDAKEIGNLNEEEISIKENEMSEKPASNSFHRFNHFNSHKWSERNKLMNFKTTGNVNDNLSKQDIQVDGKIISDACTTNHGGNTFIIPCSKQTILHTLSAQVKEENYIFKSQNLPSNPKYRPSLSNGHIGTAVHNTVMCMNGLYNGYLTDSKRAIIPSMVNWNITGTNPTTNLLRSYELNVGEGIFTESLSHKNYVLTQKFYAHRTIKELFVIEVEIEYFNYPTTVTFSIDSPKWTESYDLTFHEFDSGIKDVTYKVGYVSAPETLLAPRGEVHILYDFVPSELTTPVGQNRTVWTFLVSTGHSKSDVFAAYEIGSNMIRNSSQLYETHVQAWSELWKRGHIDIEGDVATAKAVYSSFFYITSSLPLKQDKNFPFYGLSPSGLAFGYDSDYWGHVFWDQDVWMYPGILMFHPDLALIILQARQRTYDTAKNNAKRSGDRGIRYPWESAATGIETTPSDQCAKFEIHVTGDVGLAILNYLYVTNDTKTMNDNLLVQMSRDIADFFLGRLVYNKMEDRYELYNVQGPDEDHAPVNNSAMTNALARACIKAPYEALSRMGHLDRQVKLLRDISDKIYIPFDPVLQYHPEFDGYTKGIMVKQADVVLMGFPVGYEMPAIVRKNDMSIYEPVTQPGGPAMTSALYSIGWLEIGEFDKAESSFQHNFAYIRNEFQVWSESIYGGAANFITGMGGFLQNIIFGYGGFRIRSDRLDFNPMLVPKTTGVNFVGLNYLGFTFNLFIKENVAVINITEQKIENISLKLKLLQQKKVYLLELGQPISFPLQPCSLISLL